jgi:hypothetical protein
MRITIIGSGAIGGVESFDSFDPDDLEGSLGRLGERAGQPRRDGREAGFSTLARLRERGRSPGLLTELDAVTGTSSAG